LAAYERFAGLTPEQQRTLWSTQTFYRALSLVNGGRETETDLFAGIPGAAEPRRRVASLTSVLAAPLFAARFDDFGSYFYPFLVLTLGSTIYPAGAPCACDGLCCGKA
jgi:hypothetical protein